MSVYPVVANTDKIGLGGCGGGGCPTVYEVDADTLLIQGYTADDRFEPGFVPDGENVIRIPKGLLVQFAKNYLL
ncbi:MAG: hypothetical protein ACRCSP_09255 [Rhodoglobus sp.]